MTEYSPVSEVVEEPFVTGQTSIVSGLHTGQLFIILLRDTSINHTLSISAVIPLCSELVISSPNKYDRRMKNTLDLIMGKKLIKYLAQ